MPVFSVTKKEFVSPRRALIRSAISTQSLYCSSIAPSYVVETPSAGMSLKSRRESSESRSSMSIVRLFPHHLRADGYISAPAGSGALCARLLPATKGRPLRFGLKLNVILILAQRLPADRMYDGISSLIRLARVGLGTASRTGCRARPNHATVFGSYWR